MEPPFPLPCYVFTGNIYSRTSNVTWAARPAPAGEFRKGSKVKERKVRKLEKKAKKLQKKSKKVDKKSSRATKKADKARSKFEA
jgi:hypothetical protein